MARQWRRDQQALGSIQAHPVTSRRIHEHRGVVGSTAYHSMKIHPPSADTQRVWPLLVLLLVVFDLPLLFTLGLSIHGKDGFTLDRYSDALGRHVIGPRDGSADGNGGEFTVGGGIKPDRQYRLAGHRFLLLLWFLTSSKSQC
ncbi:hypothetical protein [Reyranella sp. CPCC 100927]|uniref:hypothetical protein n=1 Tax=Reyranella sp. CPCC 100927 TaxID=2599616 RepID=UPI0011B83B6A|nr:hypothetical protein [Reyranella sp. CPCC 100927]TWT02809.1 hypothetical protein FQU96_29335 [Reyranella sp. CPCC 100927]